VNVQHGDIRVVGLQRLDVAKRARRSRHGRRVNAAASSRAGSRTVSVNMYSTATSTSSKAHLRVKCAAQRCVRLTRRQSNSAGEHVQHGDIDVVGLPRLGDVE
jgi:hypothetical protein